MADQSTHEKLAPKKLRLDYEGRISGGWQYHGPVTEAPGLEHLAPPPAPNLSPQMLGMLALRLNESGFHDGEQPLKPEWSPQMWEGLKRAAAAAGMQDPRSLVNGPQSPYWKKVSETMESAIDLRQQWLEDHHVTATTTPPPPPEELLNAAQLGAKVKGGARDGEQPFRLHGVTDEQIGAAAGRFDKLPGTGNGTADRSPTGRDELVGHLDNPGVQRARNIAELDAFLAGLKTSGIEHTKGDREAPPHDPAHGTPGIAQNQTPTKPAEGHSH